MTYLWGLWWHFVEEKVLFFYFSFLRKPWKILLYLHKLNIPELLLIVLVLLSWKFLIISLCFTMQISYCIVCADLIHQIRSPCQKNGFHNLLHFNLDFIVIHEFTTLVWKKFHKGIDFSITTASISVLTIVALSCLISLKIILWC